MDVNQKLKKMFLYVGWNQGQRFSFCPILMFTVTKKLSRSTFQLGYLLFAASDKHHRGAEQLKRHLCIKLKGLISLTLEIRKEKCLSCTQVADLYFKVMTCCRDTATDTGFEGCHFCIFISKPRIYKNLAYSTYQPWTLWQGATSEG